MQSLKLIIVNGMPATGKTSIARELKQRLNLPLIVKDDIKEFLYESLGTRDREWSRMLGQATSDFLYILADDILKSNQSLIIESAFYHQFAKPAFERIQAAHHPVCFEIYCTTERVTRRQRFAERDASGERHPGHIYAADHLKDDDPEPIEIYAPLNVGTTITIDTTNFATVDLDALITKL